MHQDLHARAQQASDNNDYCSACGGQGYLLCCDGCDRSFHFTCLDPPFDQDDHFDSKWFCSVCESARDATTRPPQGLFADLHRFIEKNNPRSFQLPEYIQQYFEGTKPGTDGEYVEVADQKPLYVVLFAPRLCPT